MWLEPRRAGQTLSASREHNYRQKEGKGTMIVKTSRTRQWSPWPTCDSKSRSRAPGNAIVVFLCLLTLGLLTPSPCHAAGSGDSGGGKKSKTSASGDQTSSSGGQAASSGSQTPPAGTIPLPTTTVCKVPDLTVTIEQSDKTTTPLSIDNILDSYESNDGNKLQAELGAIEKSLNSRCAKPNGDPKFPFPPHSRISFAMIDDHAPIPTPIRILAGDSHLPDLGSQRAINYDSLITVYVYRDWSTPILTTYTASPAASPVLTSAAQFVSSSMGALSKFTIPAPVLQFDRRTPLTDLDNTFNMIVSPDRSKCDSTQLPKIPPSRVNVVVTRTTVPKHWKWAQLTIKDNANFQLLMKADSVSGGYREPILRPILRRYREELSQLQTQCKLASDNNDAKQLTTILTKIAATQAALETELAPHKRLNNLFLQSFVLGKCYNFRLGPQTPDADSNKTNIAACQAELDDALKSAMNLNGSDDVTPELDEALKLYERYSAVVAAVGATTPAPLQTTYTYGPLTRVAFGLGGGAMFHYSTRQVKASATPGTAAPTDDPPSGAFTAVNAYISLGGYDEASLRISYSERFRPVVGVVLTPDPGGFVGVGVVPWSQMRSLTFNAGYAWMAATVIANPDEAMAAKRVTKRGTLGAWIVGLGYSF
jgi:hypothetical protein